MINIIYETIVCVTSCQYRTRRNVCKPSIKTFLRDVGDVLCAEDYAHKLK